MVIFLTLADRQPVANPEVGTVEHAFRPETGKTALASLDPAEERLERLVETADNLLLRRVTVTGQPLVSQPNGFQFVGLIDVAERLAPPLVRLDPLLETGVVEVAEAPKHVGQPGGLRRVRKEAVFERTKHEHMIPDIRLVTTAQGYSPFGDRLSSAA